MGRKEREKAPRKGKEPKGGEVRVGTKKIIQI